MPAAVVARHCSDCTSLAAAVLLLLRSLLLTLGIRQCAAQRAGLSTAGVLYSVRPAAAKNIVPCCPGGSLGRPNG